MNKFTSFVGRTAHKAMNKVGKGENTKNPEYDRAKEECLLEGKRIHDITKHIEKFMDLLGKSNEKLGETITKFKELSEATPGVAELVASLASVSESFDKTSATLKAELVAPLKHFYMQYKTMKLRISELENRRTDMDRFHNDKGDANLKYTNAKASYENLLKEMLEDFKKLHDDIAVFFEPAVALFMREQALYAAAYSKAFGQLISIGSSVDTTKLVNHPHVITPPQESVSGIDKGPKPADAAAANPADPAANPAPAATAAASTSSPTPPPKKEIAVGLYTFKAEDNTELPFNKGDRITVLSKQGEWWEGELNGKRGMFPANYVSLEQ